MSKGLINISGNAPLINGISKGNLTLPFENHIYLYNLYVAGIKYYIEDIDLFLEKDEMLVLKREPGNEFDEYAIEVFTKENIKIGYIPRAKNKIFARLMDGGKYLYGKVDEVSYYFDKIINIDIKIYMRDI